VPYAPHNRQLKVDTTLERAAYGKVAAQGLAIWDMHQHFITHFPEVYFENKTFS